MLCWLLRLWFYIKITRKSDAPAVIHSHTHKICHIILLFCHIGIQDRIIALSATPEHIALTTKFYGDFNGFFNLRRRISKHIGTRSSACATHISRMVKTVCRSPKKLYACSFHFRLDNRNDSLKILVCFF